MNTLTFIILLVLMFICSICLFIYFYYEQRDNKIDEIASKPALLDPVTIRHKDKQVALNPKIYKIRDSIDTRIKPIISGIFRTDSLVDIYYDADYDIDPTYELRDGSFIIILKEAPKDIVYFTLKVMNYTEGDDSKNRYPDVVLFID